MKNPTQTLNLTKRHQSEQRTTRGGRHLPHTEAHFQTNSLTGGCGAPAKFEGLSFYKLSKEYFAEEAPRSFAGEAGFFAALIAVAIFPIVNSLQAVATLIHTVALF